MINTQDETKTFKNVFRRILGRIGSGRVGLVGSGEVTPVGRSGRIASYRVRKG
jgi:hypothetical protein